LLRRAVARAGEEFFTKRQLEDAAHLFVARPRGLVFKEPGRRHVRQPTKAKRLREKQGAKQV